MAPLKEYDAKMDAKHRLTLRGARYSHYHVLEFENGKIVLEPRELVAPFEISARTLKVMDSSMENLKDSKTSDPIDLDSFS